ncbi:MAG: hypothetical protein IKL22_10875 [Lachnospiraceae bacterium]|nr:hypothetical protein [Lachnospiraceae bacterium]
MIIKFFIESKMEDQAIQLVEGSLNEIEEIIISKEVKNIMPYWKMENTYVIEMKIELHKNELPRFLNFYSDKWLELGYPVDELVASQNNQGCTYMREGVMMINIFL